MPLFSVIIPSWNRAALLRQALDSVFAQAFKDFELIVVDDGSTDGTMEYLTSLGSQVMALSQTNQGPAAARNLGARRAHGKYLAFLDSDDMWFPWSLKTYAAVIEQEVSPAFIVGKPLRFHREIELVGATHEEVLRASFRDYLSSGDEWRWWGVSSFVVRRDVFEATGGFAGEWINGEDADLAMRLGEAQGFVQVTSPVMFGYREHTANLMNDLGKTLAGVRYQIRAERERKYPGGRRRARERWRILTRHFRPVSVASLGQGDREGAWEIYRATFCWHVSLGRWRYLLGFPAKAWMTRQ